MSEIHDLIARLTPFVEAELSVMADAEAKDPKVKRARLAKSLRPNNSRHKARATLMGKAAPTSGPTPAEQSVTAGGRNEAQPIASFDRLIQELSVQLVNTRPDDRDKSTEKMIRLDVKTKRDVAKNAKRARGAPEQEYPWNNPDENRMIRRVPVTRPQYGK